MKTLLFLRKNFNNILSYSAAILAIVFLFITISLKHQLIIANTYINELETTIELQNDCTVGDICSGDGYNNYYK